jgi:hypothetical protein
MISAYYKSTLAAFVDTNRKRHLLPVAAVAANLARVSWVYSFKRPASLLSFAFRHREKTSPSHVANCLGETAVLDHPAYVQIFDRDRVKSSHQIGRYLVVEILATARHFQMRLGDFDPLLRAPLRSLLSARKSPLLSLQVVQRVPEVARILDLFSVRECGETANADVYSDVLSGRRHRLRFGRLANNQSIPAVNTARDPKLFALSFDRAGEPDSTGTDAGDRKFVAFDRARPNLLVFLRESVIPVFALESGKSRFLSILNTPKEALESFVNTFKSVLLDFPKMALYFGQRAGFSQVARLLIVIESCASDLITRDPLSKSGIIDLARMFKLTFARLDKAFAEAKFELEGLDCGIFGISHGVQYLNQCARWQDLMKGCKLSSGRFTYTTVGQSIIQKNSKEPERSGIALALSILLHCTADVGGTFRGALRQRHSDETIVTRQRLARAL